MPIRRYLLGQLAIVLLLCPCLRVGAQAVKDLPRATGYVSDYAHVLSPGVTRQLDLLCGAVDHQAHAQIAVVTVQTIGDEAISDYAVELEDAWKVGPKGTDRGLLVLLAVKEHKRWITTGYGLEGILPDGKVGQIGREMVPYLDRGNYDAAVSLAVNQMAGIIAQDAGVTLAQPTPVQRAGHRQAQQVHLSVGQLLVLGVVAVVFFWVASRLGLLPFLFGMLLGSSFGGGGGGGGRDNDGDNNDGGGGSGFGGFGGGSTGGGGAGGDW